MLNHFGLFSEGRCRKRQCREPEDLPSVGLRGSALGEFGIYREFAHSFRDCRSPSTSRFHASSLLGRRRASV